MYGNITILIEGITTTLFIGCLRFDNCLWMHCIDSVIKSILGAKKWVATW